MKHIALAFLLFSVITILTSCVREEIIPHSNSAKSKIVVMGFISPGERIDIYVGRSQPFGKTSYLASDFMLQNAIVTISDEQGNVQNLSPYSKDRSIYSCLQADFPVTPAKTYTIRVQAADYTEITATTTVPTNGAKWKNLSLSGPAEFHYYQISGSWDNVIGNPNNDYGVNILTSNRNYTDRTNEGITQLGTHYSIKREVYLFNSNSFKAVLLTRDLAFGEFSRKADLTLDVIENLSSSAFADIISGFKGVIPDAGNIANGMGVFGSYLKDVRTVSK